MKLRDYGTNVCPDCPVKTIQTIRAIGFRCGEFPQCWMVNE